MAVHDRLRTSVDPDDNGEREVTSEYPEILKQKINLIAEALYEKYKHYGAELAHFQPVKVGNRLIIFMQMKPIQDMK